MEIVIVMVLWALVVYYFGLYMGRRDKDRVSSSELDIVVQQYYELLYHVERKFPNESRHQTALRYICEAESNFRQCDSLQKLRIELVHVADDLANRMNVCCQLEENRILLVGLSCILLRLRQLSVGNELMVESELRKVNSQSCVDKRETVVEHGRNCSEYDTSCDICRAGYRSWVLEQQ